MTDLAKHLRTLEETLLDPGVRRSSAAVRNLLAEDFVEFGSSGQTWTRDQIMDVLATEAFSPVLVKDFTCALLAPKVALVTYLAERTDPKTGSRATSLRSSIWTEKNGQWRVRFHQGTRVG